MGCGGCKIAIKKYYVIDENGEIKDECLDGRFVHLKEGDRVVRKSSVEYLKAREEKLKHALRDAPEYINCLSDTFTKMNDTEAECIMETLDVYEKAMLYTVEPYVHYDGTIKKRNNKPLRVKDLVNLSGMSQRKAYYTIDSLIDKNILYRERWGAIC